MRRNSASRRRHAGEHKVIAVDVGVVECGGRPIRVWVMVDPYNYEVVNLCGSGYPSPARTTQNSLRFPAETEKRVSLWMTR
ncbi:hypothetical protein B9Q06_10145 [Candidatus Marsarchaeota G2 archaeon ECH_B_2]|uniref:Uncharacterized protein n=3 Tax=Candidatus Marsarchaeota group 2 TaxID=2203771 RepID=A0A2R6B6A3_9ARCH|nr:MAG: hypothetical protein B9Q06_10145 [Candidatus Marsarchaeota G2 archaeon ECH_B_2]PSN98678.1 MAG: hypothetical protein B9Q07_09055 [Candidatus Marsarchaeota G2 archaeon ECH_B_3]PSO00539.1 MAG: hypothetical protein B9Q05_10340 [Candidatus Marsarchaeota G2 archaeon ECH_B_1]